MVTRFYKLTMKYPNCVLLGEGAKGSTLSIAFAGKGQVGKMPVLK